MKKAIALLGIISISAIAQLQPGQSWGPWAASAQRGVQVRAFCRTESRLPNAALSSDWKYQLKNVGLSTVDIRWSEEHLDQRSQANRMTLPSRWTVSPGKTTPVFHTTISGSCHALAALHVVVLTHGAHSFATARIHSTRGAQPMPHGRELARSAFRGISPAHAVSAPARADSRSLDDTLTGTAWNCAWIEGRRVTFKIAFKKDGEYLITREDGLDKFPGKSEVRGDQVSWADDFGRLYTMKVSGTSMLGKTSTFDEVESRGRDYHGTLECFQVR